MNQNKATFLIWRFFKGILQLFPISWLHIDGKQRFSSNLADHQKTEIPQAKVLLDNQEYMEDRSVIDHPEDAENNMRANWWKVK